MSHAASRQFSPCPSKVWSSASREKRRIAWTEPSRAFTSARPEHAVFSEQIVFRRYDRLASSTSNRFLFGQKDGASVDTCVLRSHRSHASFSVQFSQACSAARRSCSPLLSSYVSRSVRRRRSIRSIRGARNLRKYRLKGMSILPNPLGQSIGLAPLLRLTCGWEPVFTFRRRQ